MDTGSPVLHHEDMEGMALRRSPAGALRAGYSSCVSNFHGAAPSLPESSTPLARDNALAGVVITAEWGSDEFDREKAFSRRHFRWRN